MRTSPRIGSHAIKVQAPRPRIASNVRGELARAACSGWGRAAEAPACSVENRSSASPAENGPAGQAEEARHDGPGCGAGKGLGLARGVHDLISESAPQAQDQGSARLEEREHEDLAGGPGGGRADDRPAQVAPDPETS